MLQITEHQGKIQTFGYDSDGNRLYKTVGVYWQAPREQGPIPTAPSQENGNGNGNTGGNGNGNAGNNGNAGGNGNSNGNGNGIHDNGKDKEKSNDSGKHLGWDKEKLKKEKGNKGKHLGWYKRADHPKNPNNQPLLNNPDAYEVINYVNDVSLKNTQTLMTTDQAGTYRGVYTYGLERIAERDLASVEGVPNDPLYYLYDGHNSVTQMINPAGQVRDKYRYDAFGAPMSGGQLSPNTQLFNNPYGYNGEAHDLDSGLQYLRARYYDPSMGRFMTRDSYLGDITKPLSLNRYAYTMNNPVKYADPSGHRPIVGDDPTHETEEERQLSFDYMNHRDSTVDEPSPYSTRD
ncbi:RHS repeat-associated core domain-containing protein [Desulfitobacterium sp.]|uniref:RHS repeat-associated core domain-containing protein n=1 Tax=Desulfitobacterium sp. TaxID=49981 RepID=UPI002C30970B|nr:RHS repeat-associated core domain-containing protein [Desulfitobacterium sp.]HVJ48758.1 RHS repeat-associated core domain-containing protein [Desulfitobacterium sp.]